MTIYALPRHAAERLDMAVPYAVISITDPPPVGEPANIKQCWGLRGVLRLSFHDFDEYRLPPAVLDDSYCGTRIRDLCMTLEQARQVAAFVGKLDSDVKAIVVHCEAGASRSPSIARALVNMVFPDARCVWHERPGRLFDVVNHGVYEKTLEALTKAMEIAR